MKPGTYQPYDGGRLEHVKELRIERYAAAKKAEFMEKYKAGAAMPQHRPFIQRMFRVIVFNPVAEREQTGNWVRKNAIFKTTSVVRLEVKRMAVLGYQVKKIERCWRVTGTYYDQQWNDLRYAQADRDALMDVYALHLLREPRATA